MKTDNLEKTTEKNHILGTVKRWFSEHNIIYALLILIIIASFSSDKFLSVNNVMNVLRQTSMVAIVAIGAFFIILTAGIDLSAGSLVGISGIIFAKMLGEAGMSPILAVFLILIFGALVGSFNGALVAFFNIPPFIVTLGVMEIARGFCYITTNAYPVIGLPKSISWIGRGYALGIPVPVIIMVIMFIIASFISQKTRFGRNVYAVGSNTDAARLSGINTRVVKLMTYVIGGIMAAVASIILCSRIESGQPNGGLTWEFEAITATVIGGTSISGGKGNAMGVLFGAILVGVLTNIMTLLNVNSYYQQVMRGVVLILAIGVDVFRTSRQNKA